MPLTGEGFVTDWGHTSREAELCCLSTQEWQSLGALQVRRASESWSCSLAQWKLEVLPQKWRRWWLMMVSSCTAWCSEIGSLTSPDAPELHAYTLTSEDQFHYNRLYITYYSNMPSCSCLKSHSTPLVFSIPNTHISVCMLFDHVSFSLFVWHYSSSPHMAEYNGHCSSTSCHAVSLYMSKGNSVENWVMPGHQRFFYHLSQNTACCDLFATDHAAAAAAEAVYGPDTTLLLCQWHVKE